MKSFPLNQVIAALAALGSSYVTLAQPFSGQFLILGVLVFLSILMIPILPNLSFMSS